MKKIKVEKKAKVKEEAVPEMVKVSKVAPITTDFGREDLNALAAKLNEVIENL